MQIDTRLGDFLSMLSSLGLSGTKSARFDIAIFERQQAGTPRGRLPPLSRTGGAPRHVKLLSLLISHADEAAEGPDPGCPACKRPRRSFKFTLDWGTTPSRTCPGNAARLDSKVRAAYAPALFALNAANDLPCSPEALPSDSGYPVA